MSTHRKIHPNPFRQKTPDFTPTARPLAWATSTVRGTDVAYLIGGDLLVIEHIPALLLAPEVAVA